MKILKNKKHQSEGFSKKKAKSLKVNPSTHQKNGHPKRQQLTQQQTQHQSQPHFYPQSQFSHHEPNFGLEDQFNRNPYTQGPDPRPMYTFLSASPVSS